MIRRRFPGLWKDKLRGAELPGAQIVILNTDTGISRTLPSDAAGRYLATSLALGNYRVTVTQQGFQTEIRSGIVLTVGRDAVVDLAMSVGAVTQTLEVTGEASQIDTTSATVSGLVNGEQMRELPLDGRSYTDLALPNLGVIYNRLLATGKLGNRRFRRAHVGEWWPNQPDWIHSSTARLQITPRIRAGALQRRVSGSKGFENFRCSRITTARNTGALPAGW